MRIKQIFILFAILTIFPSVFTVTRAQNYDIKKPEKYFGFEPGTERMIFNYEKLIGYLKHLDELSNRIQLVEIGQSPMNKPIYIALISSEKNIKNIDKLKEINENLAINPYMPDFEYKNYLDSGKVFVLTTLSMHSNEVGPSQSAPLIAYELVTTYNTEMLEWMDNVVLMMNPCHNPDGMDMVVENYLKYKGSKYEGSSLPGVYHKYLGHDNNRDFITLTQSDNRAISSLTSTAWFPQVLIQKHQMGTTSPRYYVPPNHDPIAENIDAEMWNWISIFGSNMMKDMTKAGCEGVSQHYFFDNYWPGSTETSLWKNVISFLTEAASVKIATSVYIEPNELIVWGKGLSEYKKSINMPQPWIGGWWKLSDIIDYEISSTYSILKTASMHREEILKFRNSLCKKEIEKGKSLAPYYYIFPANQHDKGELIHSLNLMKEHGVKVYKLIDFLELNNYKYSPGDYIIPLAQPFRSFIKEVIENQVYPVRHYTPGGKIIRPYDVTSWSIPMHRGLELITINERSIELENKLLEIKEDVKIINHIPAKYNLVVLPGTNNQSYAIVFKMIQLGARIERLTADITINDKNFSAGSFVIRSLNKEAKEILPGMLSLEATFLEKLEDSEKIKIDLPKIGLIESYYHDTDAGWTRYLFDTYHIPYTVLRPAEIKDMDINSKFDILVFPDTDPEILIEGKRKNHKGEYIVPNFPPEYTKGMTKEGHGKLIQFIDEGGIVISWGRSTGLFTNTISLPADVKNEDVPKLSLKLPVSDISGKLGNDGLYCPGSFLKIKLKDQHALTYGMQSSSGVFSRGKPVFKTSIPIFDMDRRVIAWFSENNVLLSGYIKNESLIEGHPAMVWVRKGEGQLVLYAFNPQFRSSTAATYKLLFNALLLGELK
ncbi:M14 family metallopeptidase [Bacteroidota bacterium]